MVLTRIAAKVVALPNATALDEAMRAAIILLQDVDDDTTPAAQQKADNVERLKLQDERTEKAIERMEKMMEASNAQAKETQTRLDGIVMAMRELEVTTKDAGLKTAAGLAAQAGAWNGTEEDNTGRKSFAQVVAQAPARHVDAVARIALIRRQVVLEKTGGEGADPFKDLTEKEVLAKAHLAVELLAKEGMAEADGIGFLHARKTARGGAILVTRTDGDAEWLRGESVIGRFAEKMGGALNARADLCMLVAEYVPISFEPGLFTAFGQVEQENGLAKGALREARYIKQVKYRKTTQRSAHMLMGFTSPEQANLALRKGLVIEGKHVSLRRHRINPNRCMKCQQIGAAHRAAECKSIHDTCGRCAAMHRTEACTVTDRAAFKCVSCNKTGHATVDRNCPRFIAKMKIAHARFPDYQYRFFPTQDPATWEKEDYGLSNAEEAPEEQNGGRRAQTEGHYRGGANLETQAFEANRANGRGFSRARDNGWPGRRSAPDERAGANTSGPRPTGALRQTTLDGAVHRGGTNWIPLEYTDERRPGRSAWGDAPEKEGVEERAGSVTTEDLYAHA